MPLGEIAAVLGSTIANTVLQGSQPQRQYRWNKKAAEDANRMNRENQQWLLEQNKQLRDEARMYDSPQAQMARLKAAGLNPHLIYGSGTSAGQVFPIDAGQLAPSRIDAPTAAMPDIIGNYLAASRGFASLDLTGARTRQTLIDSQAKELQMEIARTNPMLNPQVAAAVSDAMLYAASQKAQESRWMTYQYTDGQNSLAERKLTAEVEALEQRLGLNTTDLKIKNRILESKEFENAIKEIQTKWLKDGDFTPEHIRQGLMLLLTKMLGR